ncbi:hypothetical protein ACFL35_16585 [Candidatus Riflebacteria bacterium]
MTNSAAIYRKVKKAELDAYLLDKLPMTRTVGDVIYMSEFVKNKEIAEIMLRYGARHHAKSEKDFKRLANATYYKKSEVEILKMGQDFLKNGRDAGSYADMHKQLDETAKIVTKQPEAGNKNALKKAHQKLMQAQQDYKEAVLSRTKNLDEMKKKLLRAQENYQRLLE